MVSNKAHWQSLKSKKDFSSLKSKGKRVFLHSGLLFNYSPNSSKERQFRFACTIPKYVGNAVLRNRLRRCLKEAVRSNHSLYVGSGLDLNVVFTRKGISKFPKMRTKHFEHEIQKFFRKIK